jgi:hypothetical protein
MLVYCQRYDYFVERRNFKIMPVSRKQQLQGETGAGNKQLGDLTYLI